ncbi:MAG: sasA 14 [Firmicutes bacterium]|nr:sasA 14 [Bacillota bacterium]
MDYTSISVIDSSIGTLAIILIYIYFYLLHRERYMGIWAVSWLILLSRFFLFDTGFISWKHSFIGLTIYQSLIISSILIFVWGTYLFLNKPLNKRWIYTCIFLSFVSVAINLLPLPLSYKLILPLYLGCFVGIWIGLTFIRQFYLPFIGHLITGYAFILWSILNIIAPFSLSSSFFFPWGFILGGVLRMTIAFGTLIVYFEITSSKLATKEYQFRLLAENAVDVIYYYQILPNKKIDYITPSVLTLTGYTPEEYYNDNTLFFSLVHPDDIPLITNFVKELPNSIELPLTLRIISKNKTTLWLEHKCVPIYDKQGRLIALEGIVRDITTRQKLEQMASLFDRMNMVGNMAATVAHEIRNPLTTVRGYLQVMGTKEKYLTDKDKFLLMIEEIDRANSIIREYLSLSREKLADFKMCSLNGIIETLFPLIQANAISTKVYAKLKLCTIPELLLDENEIRQMLLNLTRNSIEAMPSGGILLIRTYLENNKVILSISDQGSGIPPNILDKLGTPFVTSKDTGTGLGLPICYRIAHRHNAKIKIDTGNTGTTFFICFN